MRTRRNRRIITAITELSARRIPSAIKVSLRRILHSVHLHSCSEDDTCVYAVYNIISLLFANDLKFKTNCLQSKFKITFQFYKNLDFDEICQVFLLTE